jgi:hypothetical protein
MLTHLDDFSPVNLADPVNREHPLNRGRVGWWLTLPGLAGGGTFWDLMGLNHGALTGMGAGLGWKGTSRPGGYGALQGDGTAACVIIPNSPSLNPTVGVTCSCWVKPASTADAGLVCKDSNVGRSYCLDIESSGKPQFFIGPSQVVSASTTILTPGQWIHVCGTYNGAGTALYINGIQVATAAGSPTLNVTTGTVQLGAREYAGLREFCNGQIDDCSIWNRGITPIEVYGLFNLSRLGYPGVLNRWPQRMVDLQSGTAWTKALTETLALSDARVMAVARTLVESLSLTDVRSASLARVLSEVLALTDTRAAAVQKVMSETLVLTDARSVALARRLAETYNLTDVAAGQIVAAAALIIVSIGQGGIA